MASPGPVPGKCPGHWNTVKNQKLQPSSNTIVVRKTSFSVHAVCTPVDCLKDLQKYDIYINEEGMYELLFSSQQPKTKNFRKHCCNVMFPHIWQPLTNKMVDELRHEHQQAIEEHEQVITLLSDNLQGRHSQIEAIQCENVGLQAEIREKG